jgi:hypothetical protein
MAAQVAQSIIQDVVARYNWNNSDSMTDYFDVRFHGHVELRVTGEDFGHLRVDRALSPVAIGDSVGRFGAQDVYRLTPYAIARAEEEAHAENARRDAEVAEAAAVVDAEAEAFAAQLDTVTAPVEAIEAEARATIAQAHADEIAENVAEVESYADALAGVALAEETIARQPNTYRVAGYERRSIHATWVLTWHDEERTQPHEVTELWVSHDKGRGFVASLHRGTVGAPSGTGMVGTTYGDMLGAPAVGTLIPAGRFSRKGLVAATKAKVAEVIADPAQYLHKFVVSSQVTL